MDKEVIRPVICQAICTTQADDYCGMHMSNESCIACNTIWTQAHLENKDREIVSMRAELNDWHSRAIQSGRERNEARQELRLNQIRHADKIIENSALKRANAALLEGCRAIYSDMQHKETLEHYETNPKEFVEIVVGTLGVILAQYDTAPKEDKKDEQI